MNAIRRLLSLVINYKRLVSLHVVSNILTAIFTVLSLPIIIPIFELFFKSEQTPDLTPVEFSISNFNHFLQYRLQEWIHSAPTTYDAMIKICILLITVFFLKNVFQYLALFFIAPVRNGVIRDLREQLFHKISNLPLSFFTKERRGDIISRMSADVQEVEWSILSTLEKLVRDPLIVIGTVAFMLSISAKLTFFVIVMLLFTGLIIGGIANRLKRQSGEVQSSLGRILSGVEEALAGSKVIKAFTAETYMEGRFATENNLYRKLHTRLLWRRDMASPLSEILGIVAVCILFVFGTRMVSADEISSEFFLAYLLAFFYTITPSKSIANAYYNVQKGLAAFERIDHILKYENPILSRAGNLACKPLAHSIILKNVSFEYTVEQPGVLKNINLIVPKGKTIALVGSSGSGKSTLANLLLRFYDPSEGQILFDNEALPTFEVKSLRKQFGVVTQEPFLFNASVAENISFGSGITDLEKIKYAAELAFAHDFIMNMPDQFSSNVGDAGQKLSGGQRQRIALARAILTDPSVLILDEATSALDSESEMAVQKAMVNVLKNRTAIVIAHRLATIQHANEIVVLKDGEIVESGSHEELLSKKGDYLKFVELQRM